MGTDLQRLEPCYDPTHKTQDKPLFKYTQIQLNEKENIMVSPDAEEEQSCQTGYLTASFALTSHHSSTIIVN